MNITDDELLELVDDVHSTLIELILSYREISETLIGKGYAASTQKKIDSLKDRLDIEKERLIKTKDANKRKAELLNNNRLNAKGLKKEGTSRSFAPIANGKGQVIGFLQVYGPKYFIILDSKGKVAARFIDGKTYNAAGRYEGGGNQLLRILGQRMAA